jgi:ribosomal protein L37AE/L43A
MIYLDVHAPEPEVKTGKKAAAKIETAARTGKILNLGRSSTLKNKSSDKIYCPYCNRETVLIWVHSHYQCSRCKYVVVSCCEAN